jgi:hypothetical protein
MRQLGDPAFFRTFDLLVFAANPVGARKKSSWEKDGTRWTFERHGYQGLAYAVSTSVYFIESQGKAGWRMLVVQENWSAGENAETLRELRWAKLLSGDRNKALDWFKCQDPM